MADYNQPDYVEKRVRYFDGQFLKDQDFIDEQKYFLDRQRRYHRFLHVSGIVDGLAVKVKAGTSDLVTVDPGTALDSKGRQVVLSDVVPETDRQIPLQRLRGTTGTVVITYNEEGSDQAQVGSAGFTRFYEKPKLTMVPSGQTVPEGAITLARLTISASGVVEIDNTVRVYAGVRLPYDGAAPGAGPALRAGNTSRLDIIGDVSVSGDINIGRANAPAKLYVNGPLQVTGSNALEFGAGVSGKEVSAGKIGYQTFTSDTLDIVGAGTTVASRKIKLWAEGGASLAGNLTITGSVGIGTTDPGSDKLKVDGTLSVTGASTLTGNTSVGGTLTVTKTSTLTGNTSIGGTLTVTKTSTLTGNTSIGGTLTVTEASTLTGNTSIGGTLSVIGTSTLTGSVGIGVAAPASNSDIKLAVNGKITGLMFGARYIYAEKKETPDRDQVLFHLDLEALSDGFVVAILEVRDQNADCWIEGLIVEGRNYTVRASAAINWVANQDWPIQTNSFTMPVIRGEKWNVMFKRVLQAHNKNQNYSIYWVPLGA